MTVADGSFTELLPLLLMNLAKLSAWTCNVFMASQGNRFSDRARLSFVLKSTTLMLDMISSMMVINDSMTMMLPGKAGLRPIYASKWADWAFTTPLLMLDLLLLTNARTPARVMVMTLASQVMLLGLAGEVSDNDNSFWLATALSCMLYVVMFSFVFSIISTMNSRDVLRTPVRTLATIMFLSWTYYPTFFLYRRYRGWGSDRSVLQDEIATVISKTGYCVISLVVYSRFRKTMLYRENYCDQNEQIRRFTGVDAQDRDEMDDASSCRIDKSPSHPAAALDVDVYDVDCCSDFDNIGDEDLPSPDVSLSNFSETPRTSRSPHFNR